MKKTVKQNLYNFFYFFVGENLLRKFVKKINYLGSKGDPYTSCGAQNACSSNPCGVNAR